MNRYLQKTKSLYNVITNLLCKTKKYVVEPWYLEWVPSASPLLEIRIPTNLMGRIETAVPIAIIDKESDGRTKINYYYSFYCPPDKVRKRCDKSKEGRIEAVREAGRKKQVRRWEPIGMMCLVSISLFLVGLKLFLFSPSYIPFTSFCFFFTSPIVGKWCLLLSR